MENKRVAIVIVTYNGQSWIDKCIKPLYGFEYVKIIVIDNNSSDNTVEIIKEKFPLVHLINSNINLGFGKANNYGFDYAMSNNFDFVFLLNQDASIDYLTLKKLIHSYQQDNSIGILSPVHYKNEAEVENVFEFYLKDSNISFSEVGSLNITDIKFVNAALWLISLENLKKIGGFNPLYFHYGEDVDFVNRVKYNQLKIKVDLSCRGFHYRNYTKENFKKKFDKSRYFGSWDIKYYTILTNINNSNIKVFFDTFKLFFKSFFKYLIKGYFSSSLICFKVYFNVLKQAIKITNNRKLMMFAKSPFLNLTK